VARELLGRGFGVRALTRDPEKPAAKELAERGAEVVRGDLDDRSSLERVLEGVHGIFSVQNFWETGYEREVRQGTQPADAAKEAGVSHLVYSSVGSAHRQTGLQHFESKWEVEEHVRGSGVPYTILRPVFFMQNWEAFGRDQILGGTLAQPLDPDETLQSLAVEDIGVFAAMAFEDPEGWIGREVNYYQGPWNQFEQAAGEEPYRMYRWFNDYGYEADIASLREEHPGLITGARIERNVVYGNGVKGGSAINCDGVQDSLIRNNLLYGNHASGISLYRIDAAEGAKNNVVVNNTIRMASDGRWAVNIKNRSTGNTVSNNVLLHDGFRGAINILPDSLSGFVSDHNAVTNRFSTDDGESFLTLAQWRNATNQDENSFVAGPAALFADASADDYHLSATSPAIDGGSISGRAERGHRGQRPSVRLCLRHRRLRVRQHVPARP
jgi:uncharacterized protein YbjT (DUF2867 family)